jgi:hypothetical protein
MALILAVLLERSTPLRTVREADMSKAFSIRLRIHTHMRRYGLAREPAGDIIEKKCTACKQISVCFGELRELQLLQ